MKKTTSAILALVAGGALAISTALPAAAADKSGYINCQNRSVRLTSTNTGGPYAGSTHVMDGPGGGQSYHVGSGVHTTTFSTYKGNWKMSISGTVVSYGATCAGLGR